MAAKRREGKQSYSNATHVPAPQRRKDYFRRRRERRIKRRLRGGGKDDALISKRALSYCLLYDDYGVRFEDDGLNGGDEVSTTTKDLCSFSELE